MKRKKYKKVARRAIIYLIVMAFLITTFTCLGIGLRYNREMKDRYRSFALSYTHFAADYIDGDTIAKYLKTNKKDAYYEKVMEMLNSAQRRSGLRYYYVFVPFEDDLVYIWDADNFEGACPLGYHEDYMDGGKEAVEKIYNKNPDEDITITVDEKYGYIASAYSPIYDSTGKPVAVAAVDIAMTDVILNLVGFTIPVIVTVLTVTIFAIIVFYLVMKRKLISPIESINNATRDMVQNIRDDNQTDISVDSGDEIEELADSFNAMHKELRDYIKQNAEITAEKERIVTELSLAQKIQASMLPNIFPAFPEREEFDIFASMTPAKEVGGDFYDFFLINERYLALVIADVSGKGIPAALFMMMSKILIKNAALSGKSPSEVLETVNNQICANNNEEMFVTVWLGMLDLKTGLLTAANAGHEKPIVKQPDDNFILYPDKNGFVVGGMSGLKYKNYEIKLEKGAKLFLYTDGVAEATNANNELFGIERTLETLNSVKDGSVQDTLVKVKEDIDIYVGGAPQFDDLTMLCMEYKGGGDEIVLDATLENVTKSIEFVSQKAEGLDFSHKDNYQIEIAVDEMFTNIARYAYGENTGKAELKVEASDGVLSITLSDSGIPYNPLEKEDPDTTLSAEEREVGGYGIFIVKKVMDEIHYEYKDGKNILTMKKAVKNEQNK